MPAGHFDPLPDAKGNLPVTRGRFIDVEIFGNLNAETGTLGDLVITGSVTIGAGGSLEVGDIYSSNWESGGGTVPLNIPATGDSGATAGYALDASTGNAQFKRVIAETFIGDAQIDGVHSWSFPTTDSRSVLTQWTQTSDLQYSSPNGWEYYYYDLFWQSDDAQIPTGIVSQLRLATGIFIEDGVGVTNTDAWVELDARLEMSSTIHMGSNKITNLATPTATTDAATKAYADLMLPLAGGTLTGLLTLSGAPTVDLHAATKKYVDDNAGGDITNPVGADIDMVTYQLSWTGIDSATNMIGVRASQGISLELGRTDGTTGTPFIDFHTGSDNDYTSRLLATGDNTTTIGAGGLDFLGDGSGAGFRLKDEGDTVYALLKKSIWSHDTVAQSTAHGDDEEFDDTLSGTAVTTSGTVTWSQQRSRLSVKYQDVAANDFAGRVYALTPSSSPVTIEGCFTRLMQDGTLGGHAGICFADGTTSTDSIIGLTSYHDPTNDRPVMREYYNTFAVPTAGNSVNYFIQSEKTYFRIVWSAANTFEYFISPDGISWTKMGVADRTDTFTPTHFGVIVSNWDSTSEDAIASFEYIRVVESDLS